MDLIFSSHARQRMALRQVAPEEVKEALQNLERESAGRTSDRINRWGRTRRGRRLRITQYRDSSRFVITVATPDEEHA